MWVIGGMDEDTNIQNDVWYSSDGVTWTQATAAPAFSARVGSYSVAYNNKMWMIGGTDESDNYLNDVWYSSDGAAWIQATAAAAFSPRSLSQ